MGWFKAGEGGCGSWEGAEAWSRGSVMTSRDAADVFLGYRRRALIVCPRVAVKRRSIERAPGRQAGPREPRARALHAKSRPSARPHPISLFAGAAGANSPLPGLVRGENPRPVSPTLPSPCARAPAPFGAWASPAAARPAARRVGRRACPPPGDKRSRAFLAKVSSAVPARRTSLRLRLCSVRKYFRLPRLPIFRRARLLPPGLHPSAHAEIRKHPLVC